MFVIPRLSKTDVPPNSPQVESPLFFDSTVSHSSEHKSTGTCAWCIGWPCFSLPNTLSQTTQQVTWKTEINTGEWNASTEGSFQKKYDGLYILLRLLPHVSVACDDQSLSTQPELNVRLLNPALNSSDCVPYRKKLALKIQHLAQAASFKSGSVSHTIAVTSLHWGIRLLFPIRWFTTRYTIHQGRRCPRPTVVNIPLTPSLRPPLRTHLGQVRDIR